MAGFNKSFDLSVEDVELIEMALHKTMAILSRPDLDATLAEGESTTEPQEALRQISELLGRMHNQKNFYRPKDEVYVGG